MVDGGWNIVNSPTTKKPLKQHQTSGSLILMEVAVVAQAKCSILAAGYSG
jgi:hypothetical protein